MSTVALLSAVAVGLLVGARLGSATGTDGNTIASPDTLGLVGWYSSLALDPSGNPAVSYYHAGSSDLKLLRCGNATCTAGNAIASPDTQGFAGILTSLALDASDNPVVSYTLQDVRAELRVLHCGDATCTSGNTIASPDPASDVLYATPIVLDIDGNPVVAYYDDINDDLKVLHCGDPDCSAGNTIAAPDVLGFAGAYASLALDADGNPVVSYNRNFDLRVLHCGDPTCASGNTFASPDTAGLVGDYTSLALDDDGNPVVSYYDTTNGDLKVLHCGNASCTSGNTTTSPDTAGDVGLYTSLALGADGNPVVSYYDASNGDLKLLRCGNASCTSGNTIASPDTAGDVGLYTSLVLGTGDKPVVSYHDASSGDLKVLSCIDPACTGVKPPPPPTPTSTPGPTATPTPKGPDGDTDGDTIPNSSDIDDDNDGCTDVAELETASGSETSGGRRNPHNFWDFFDVYTGGPPSRDQAVIAADIAAQVLRFGAIGDPGGDPFVAPSDLTGYHSAFDRGGTVPGLNVWNLLAPDGAIIAGDIASLVLQFGHVCAQE